MLEPVKLKLHLVFEPHGPKVKGWMNSLENNSISELPNFPCCNQKKIHKKKDSINASLACGILSCMSNVKSQWICSLCQHLVAKGQSNRR